MSTKALYMDDSYIKEFNANVVEVTDKGVVLDQTAFYPKGGGLPSDTGKLVGDFGEVKVTHVFKEGDKIYHVVEGEVCNNCEVKGLIDWEKRYKIMRMHTAAHMLSGLLYKELGVLITGGIIKEDESHMDFSLERTDRELLDNVVRKANELIKEGRPVKIYYMEREKALNTPGMVKLAERMPPSVKILRIVEIEGIDVQADGGPHVSNIKEIGEIVLLKIKNKGKNRKRIYYTVKP
ncbi:MAG: alanyl-tRNA editing protein AlaXM [Candidatus Njordarchaeia archaeon]